VDGFFLPTLFECRACGVRFVDCEAHVRHELGCTAERSAAEPAESSPVRLLLGVSRGGS
jgi:hypothetical protein